MILVSTHCRIMLNFCTKFHETTSDSFNAMEGARFPYCKATREDTILNLNLKKALILRSFCALRVKTAGA